MNRIIKHDLCTFHMKYEHRIMSVCECVWGPFFVSIHQSVAQIYIRRDINNLTAFHNTICVRRLASKRVKQHYSQAKQNCSQIEQYSGFRCENKWFCCGNAKNAKNAQIYFENVRNKYFIVKIAQIHSAQD